MILRHTNQQRRGVVLMVVLAMLTLFAAVGLAFVSYTESQATQAQNQKQSEVIKLPDADIVFNNVMRQLVFGTTDNKSALYTHSLLADMYGFIDPTVDPPASVQNRIPFTGTGRLNTTDPTGVLGNNNARYFPNFQNRIYHESVFGSLNPPYSYANHDHFYLGGWSNTGNGNEVVARSFVRDAVIRLDLVPLAPNPDHVDFAFNPYDLRDPFLRKFWAWDSALLPNYSYDLPIDAPPPNRTYISPPVFPNPNYPAIDPVHPFVRRFFATNAQDVAILRAMVMRPGPWTNFVVNPVTNIASPTFPPPGDFGGDIKNLPPDMKTVVKYIDNADPQPTRVTGNADSIWMDFNFPPLTASNGKKYKPLVAPFITDLDGKINVNVAGNQRGRIESPDPNAGTYSSSANGVGPYEINPEKIFSVQEVRNLLAGRTEIRDAANAPRQVEYARYGYVDENSVPLASLRDPATPVPVTNYSHLMRPAPFYGRYNLDGTLDGFGPGNLTYGPSPRHLLNTSFTPPTLLIDRFPKQNGQNQGYNNGTIAEVTRPLNTSFRSPLYNSPFNPYFPTTPFLTRDFSPQNLEAMYRRGDVGADALESELRRILPNAFTDPAILRRLTTTSYDLNRSPVAPWVDDYSNPGNRFRFQLPNDVRPEGRPIAYPATPPSSPPSTNVGDYYPSPQSTWRSILATLPRLDLNRPLPDYPPCPQIAGVNRPDLQIDLTNTDYAKAVQQAILARQELARDIFFRFILVTNAYEAQRIDTLLRTGNMPPFATLGTPQEEDALRWLAQLSVNIVDYIDNDDYMTPFDWYDALQRSALGPQFVMGTELPRLQINEAYVEAVQGNTNGNRATGDYGVSTWVELYNPLMNQTFGSWNDGPNVRFRIGGQNVYQLVVTTSNNVTNIRARDRVTGNVDNPALGLPSYLVVPINGYPDPTIPAGSVRTTGDIAPGDDNYVRPNPLPIVNPQGLYNNQGFSAIGFYLIGPSNFAATSPTPMQVDEANPQLAIQNRYSFNPTDQAGQLNSAANQQAVLLQRLACPYLPYNPPPPDPLYQATLPVNPYITIDYAEKIIANNAIQFDHAGNNAAFQAPNSRASIGKLQPYASQWQLWRRANPAPLYADGATPQNTLLRQNGRAAAGPTPGTNSPNTETIKTPFDWLVHLDRPVMSPVELLHVSGYKPHELTQQFAATPPSPPTALYALPAPVVVGSQPINLTARGAVGGVPWTLQVNDLVLIVDAPFDATANREWVCVTNIAADYSNFTATFSQAHLAGSLVAVSVPHAQFAPWFLADNTPPLLPFVVTPSLHRIYRFLDMVAVRNPQVQMSQGRMFIRTPPVHDMANGVWTVEIDPANLALSDMPLVAPNGAILDIADGTKPGVPATVLAYNGGTEYVRVISFNKDNNTLQAAFLNPPAIGGMLDITYHSGRQPGRLNLNTLLDQEVFAALLDRQPSNVFSDSNGNDVAKEFQRLYAARQPNFFTGNPRPRIGGLQNIPNTGYNTVVEDQPLLPLTTGDANTIGLGISRTVLQPVANDTRLETAAAGNPRRDSRNRLFETGFYEPIAGTFTPITNPFERFDVYSKVFNNTTTRSNTFAIWLTIGFFEVDDSGVLGAELNQLDGRNTRYRFFAVVDRSILDEWFAAMNWMTDPTMPAANALITTPSIDPRYASDINTAAICPVGGYTNLIPGNVPGTWQLALSNNTNYSQFTAGQIIQVIGMGSNGSMLQEATQVLTIGNPQPNYITARLRYGQPVVLGAPQYVGNLVVKQIPVPPTILYWSQIK